MNRVGRRIGAVALLAAGLLCSWSALASQETPAAAPQAVPYASGSRLAGGKTVTIVVPGNLPWTDTGIDVSAGDEVLFAARGRISLQKGNPESECGPEGYDIETVQQPLPGENMGALIGKVVIAVIETVDEKTKLEKRDEIAQIFFLGSGGQVEMPARGRLFLGINESVIGDNSGEFTVTIEPGAKERRSD